MTGGERGGHARACARDDAEILRTERRRRLSRELSTPVGFIHRFAPVTGSVSMKACSVTQCAQRVTLV